MAKETGSYVLNFCAVLSFLTLVSSIKYEPNWKSLDSRPIPAWYDESKIGIFIHWGVFSVPSFRSEWFWEIWKEKEPDVVQFMKDNYKPDFTYPDFAKDFTAEFYNPDQWADIFNASGARYIVFTSKHHEGFTNWPSKYSFNWNAMSVGPNKDLVGMLAKSIRTRTNLRFGLYHSLYEWFNPLFLQDQRNSWKTQDFAMHKSIPELYEIVNTYKPDVVWSDGPGQANDTYWNSTAFLAWLYNDSPVADRVVTNDRWGRNCMCKHGGVLTCGDRFNPGVLQKRKWVNAMTIDKTSWGFRRNAKLSEYLTMKELVETVVMTIRGSLSFQLWSTLIEEFAPSCGGNILINVGPTKAGEIVPIFEERLRGLGAWLKVNGEAVYGSKPWKFQNDTVTPGVWYTSKKNGSAGMAVYAFVFNWPNPGPFFLAAPQPTKKTEVRLLGYPDPIGWKEPPVATPGIYLEIPVIPFNKQPCDNAWVFKMEGLAD